MRKLYFLVPGTDGKFACGGLWAELNTCHLAKQVCPAEVVTYCQREQDTLFLDDLLQEENLDDVIFIISWGFHVPKLAARLKRHHVVYHAHSAGYRFKLPASMPIITVSRHTMGYWGQKSPNSLIYYLPNHISNDFQNLNLERDIDILVQTRKSSEYLLKELIPTLQNHCKVVVLDSHVEDLIKLFNRAKIYLYDSAEYWEMKGVSEGFGLPPMESLACGCQVFSSVNDALADYLDPGFNCHKIAGYSKEYDVQRILKMLNSPPQTILPDDFFEIYRTESITKRLKIILDQLNEFFDHTKYYHSNIKGSTKLRLSKLIFQRFFSKLVKKSKNRIRGALRSLGLR
ncbi:MAG: glycosyltransferase [Pseudanabaenales cyanobacterium]|nr:glycosyltransferase [Pseudanabaenales cyanobacterium]